MEIWSALIIGFLGSLHCIGMCGPIAVALPVPNSSNFSFVTGRILYNAGRVISYSFLGFIFGLVGQGIMITGFQQALSISLGVIILISVVLPKRFKSKLFANGKLYSLTNPLRKSIGKLFKRKTLSSFLMIGILNGFLPCGFVYIGIAGAAATGSTLNGALFMMLFGLGTSPAMFAATVFGKFINIEIRRKISKAIPVFAFIMALVFILRGMNLGVPYLSPEIKAANAARIEAECCH